MLATKRKHTTNILRQLDIFEDINKYLFHSGPNMPHLTNHSIHCSKSNFKIYKRSLSTYLAYLYIKYMNFNVYLCIATLPTLAFAGISYMLLCHDKCLFIYLGYF